MRNAPDRPRYDPEKVRARAEEALGWEPGASRDLSFAMLREALKAKPEKWKAAKDIDDMLRTGDHLSAPARAPFREYVPSEVFDDEEEGGGPFGRAI